jgi:GT2 family glycosyltransferase
MLGKCALKRQELSSNCDVIIVNFNAGDLLSLCVSSVLREGIGKAIIVDNASNDTSLLQLERNFLSEPKIQVIQNQANLGFAKACNIGLAASSAQNILFLNPDSTLEAGALNRMVSVLESDSSIGMVGGLLCNPDGSEQPGGRRVFPTPRLAFMRAFGLSRLAAIFPNLLSDFLLHKKPLPAEPTPIEAISGACMLVKREAINDVGLWDEGYFLHCEDLDWCMRFRQKGWQIFFVPDAKVFHVWGGCSLSRPIFVEWHKHRGMLRFYRKFYVHQYPEILMWLVTLGVWFRFAAVAIYYTGSQAGRLFMLAHG